MQKKDDEREFNMARNKRTVIPKQPGSQYTDQQRRAVIADYAATGNISKTAANYSLPRTTVTGWVRSEWGKELIVKIRHSDEQASVTNLTKPNGNVLGADSLTGPGSKYTDEERRGAALEYGVYGNMAKVARTTGIPETTLFYWKNHSDFWDTLVVGVRGEKADEQRQGYSLIVDKAHKEIVDRLDKGDFVHYQGKKIRIPVKAKEAAIISGIATEKIHLADNRFVSTGTNQNATEAIMALAQQFKELSDTYKAKDVNVIGGQCAKLEEDQEE